MADAQVGLDFRCSHIFEGPFSQPLAELYHVVLLVNWIYTISLII